MKKFTKYFGRNLKLVIVLVTLSILFNTKIKAQFVAIPDPAFRAAIQSQFPGAISGNLLDTTNTAIVNANYLNYYSLGINDITGIQYFDSLHNLGIGGNNLTFLPVMPYRLYNLDISANNFTTLPTSFPPFLENLFCDQNNSISIPQLPASLLYFSCWNCQLTNLPALPLGLNGLNCGSNQLTYLPSFPSGFKSLLCENNQLSCLPYLPDGMDSVYAYTGNTITCRPNIPFNPNFHSDLDSLPLCGPSGNCPYSRQIQGKCFLDANSNCVFDANEIVFKNFEIITNTGAFAFTDSNGNYILHVFPDTVNISLYSTLNFWTSTCPGIPYTIDMSSTDSLAGIDFPLQANGTPCPYPLIDIASSPQRPCFSNNYYYINYINLGSDSLLNAVVKVTFPPELTPLSSTPSWSSIAGNVLTYNIGTLGIAETGSIVINDFVDCNVPTHKTVCANVEILPRGCQISTGTWDSSSVSIDGLCSNDSIRFLLRNIGSGNMTANGNYTIYEDNVLFAAAVPFQLISGDSIVVTFAGTGKTYRMDATQSSGHPGISNPRKIIEFCGTSNFSFGYVTAVAQDDADNYFEEDCRLTSGAIDPNEKTVQPSGLGGQHYIVAGDELEYYIQFQNTGNDTAFKVVLTDTIDVTTLDLTTFQPGVSSHSYTITSLNNVLIFTFNNILLPDSNVNEPASHGFVKFKIKQQPGNAPGTVINNKANIYFDFNAPVITNTAYVTIETISFIFSSVNELSKSNEINVYPNPSNGNSVVELKTPEPGSYTFELINSLGQVVVSEKIMVGSNKLMKSFSVPSSGIYVVRLTGKNGSFTKKLINK